MRYDIIHSSIIKDNTVSFTTAASEAHPRVYTQFDSPEYTKLFLEHGLEALFTELYTRIWTGKSSPARGSRITSILDDIHQTLLESRSLRYFLDTDMQAHHGGDALIQDHHLELLL